jgi:DNA-binding MarR family transcriptional regulator
MPQRAAGGDDAGEVAVALLDTYRWLLAITASSMEAVAGTLTVPQFRLLTVVQAHGPANLSRLARYLGVHPSTTLRMINRMVGTGMIRRVPPAGSRHEIQISLTDAGKQVVRSAGERRGNDIARVAGQLSPALRRDLVSALRTFNEAAGAVPAGLPPLTGWE